MASYKSLVLLRKLYAESRDRLNKWHRLGKQAKNTNLLESDYLEDRNEDIKLKIKLLLWEDMVGNEA
jgi:hypothetical protein